MNGRGWEYNSMQQSESEQQRAFYRRQADRLLELAKGTDGKTAEVLTAAAQYYLEKLAGSEPAAAAA